MKNLKEYYPKNMWVVRIDGCKYVIKARQEDLERLWKEDKITEYTSLKAYKIA